MNRLFLLLLLPSTIQAEVITLTIDPANLSTTTYTTLNGQAVTSTTATGTIEADVTIDPVTQKPTTITFSGGTITYSDANSTYTPNAQPPVENLILNAADVTGILATTNPTSPVDPATGALVNEDHTTTLNSGTLYIQFDVLIVGNPLNLFTQTTDFAVNPAGSPFFGNNTLTTTLAESSPLTDTLTVTLTTTPDPSPFDLEDLDIVITGEGGFSALGTIEVTSATYLAWLSQHSPSDESPKILYALGFPPSQSQLPLSFSAESATLTLPDSGTLLPALIQHSTDLESWNTLQSLPAGSSGPQTITLPDSAFAFLRVVLE